MELTLWCEEMCSPSHYAIPTSVLMENLTRALSFPHLHRHHHLSIFISISMNENLIIGIILFTCPHNKLAGEDKSYDKTRMMDCD